MTALSKRLLTPIGAMVYVAVCLQSSTPIFAEPATFEVTSKYSEYLVGEPVMVRVGISNPSGNDVLSVVKLSGATMYPGSFDTELVDPTGAVLGFGRVSVRIQPSVFEKDLVKIAPGTRWEGEQNAQVPKVSGRHLVRVTYRPKWKGPPEITREFWINVIDPKLAVVGPAAPFQNDDGVSIEVSKVHNADGFWLYSKIFPEGPFQRLVQISEKTNFKVSDRQNYKDVLGGVRVITYDADGEEHMLRVENQYGQVIPDERLGK